jgi:hypothetical protein
VLTPSLGATIPVLKSEDSFRARPKSRTREAKLQFWLFASPKGLEISEWGRSEAA